MNTIVVSQYLVCCEPNIWVFDDLLSTKFLNHIDNLFEHGEVFEHDQFEGGKSRRTRSIQIGIDESTVELVDVISAVAGIRQVEACRLMMVADVYGENQDPHMDHISLQDLEKRYDKLQFLDLCRQSRHVRNPSKIVPTISIVVYFNDAGGICFPQSPGMKQEIIPSKRGRIVMFQNFQDSLRPESNKMATHYGFYFGNVPRRLMTMGILANTTPKMKTSPCSSDQLVDALLYCAGVRDEGIRHDWMEAMSVHAHASESAPVKPKPPPKRDMLLTLDAKFEDDEWTITMTSIAGSEACTLRAKPSTSIQELRKMAKDVVDPRDTAHVHLVMPDGRMVILWDKDSKIQHLFMEDEAKAMAPALEPDMFTKIWRTFVEYDTDCSGDISPEELVMMFRELDPSFSETELLDFFRIFDVNADGKLQWIEFLEFLRSEFEI